MLRIARNANIFFWILMRYDGRMIRISTKSAVMAALLAIIHGTAVGAEMKTEGDRMMARYFAAQATRIADSTLAEIRDLNDWTSRRDKYRLQLAEMLGLHPEPERTPLNPVVTGVVNQDHFEVRNLRFESMPGLYVTANLYVPSGLTGRAPAVLYVCGHAPAKVGEISYGNKTSYQHHPAWFASNGYVSLVIDTVQLGEIEGIHHGTYRERMWWWNSRGYTPAGVEAWNCIRAVDYLQSLEFVNGDAIGITGRSGGGVYSWWAAALDDRISVAAPVAGITDLRNHVIDGTVEGHCDCMFHVNTHRWDFAMITALVAPRPLMILNTDSDSIFPLDGVYRVFEQTRRIYRLYGKEENIGLVITPGGHRDTQELRLPAFKWFNTHLMDLGEDIPAVTTKYFEPGQLRVLTDGIPGDQRNSIIHDSFTMPRMKMPEPQNRTELQSRLLEKCFGGWPGSAIPLNLKKALEASRDGLTLTAWDFDSQEHVRLRIYSLRATEKESPEKALLHVPGSREWSRFLNAMRPQFPTHLDQEIRLAGDQFAGAGAIDTEAIRSSGMVHLWFVPRAMGRTTLTDDERHLTHTRRRFMLLGQTLAGMQTWDIHRAIDATRELITAPLDVEASGTLSLPALLAGLFHQELAGLEIDPLGDDDKTLPDILNLSLVSTPSLIRRFAGQSFPVTVR